MGKDVTILNPSTSLATYPFWREPEDYKRCAFYLQHDIPLGDDLVGTLPISRQKPWDKHTDSFEVAASNGQGLSLIFGDLF